MNTSSSLRAFLQTAGLVPGAVVAPAAASVESTDAGASPISLDGQDVRKRLRLQGGGPAADWSG